MATAAFPGQLQRITLVADEALEKDLVDHVRRLGAASYISTYCSGKALHDAYERPSAVRPLVRIEVLAVGPVAEVIVDYIGELQLRNSPVTAVMDTVLVCPLAKEPAADRGRPGRRERLQPVSGSTA